MTDLWSFLLQTLTVSGVALLLLALKAILRDKLPPRWQFGIWSVLAAVILFPAGWGGHYALVNWPMAVDYLRMMTGDFAFTRVTFPFPLVLTRPETLFDWMFVVYAGGVAVALARCSWDYARLGRIIRQGTPLSEEAFQRIRNIAIRHGLPGCTGIVVDGLPSAFLFGLVKPVLVLPREDAEEHVILHELIHRKNRDTLWSMAICLLRALHWCNPLVRFCANQALNDLEARCDQMVLELLQGEDRREYGKTLLSMVNDRYASIPGATCVNNGGKSIRRRIEAIARFRLYPAGMRLVSLCVGLVLLLAVIPGTRAVTVFESNTDAFLTLASARTVCCTTPAGAFDCYAKAVLNRNGAYRAMCAPEAEQQALAEAIHRENPWGKFPYWNSGIPSWPDANSGYYIYNLSCRDDVYQGLLVVNLNYPPNGQPAEDNTLYLAYQSLLVEQEQGRWVTRVIGDFQTLSVPEGTAIINWECWQLPALHYVAQYEDFYIDLRVQTVYDIENNWSYQSGFFGSTQTFNTVPIPNAEFGRVSVSHDTTLTHLGTQEQRDAMTHLGLAIKRVLPGEAPPEDQETYYTNGASSPSTSGASWSNRYLEPGWGPELKFYGGGSKYQVEEYLPDLPEYYHVDLYLEQEFVTSLILLPEEGGIR